MKLKNAQSWNARQLDIPHVRGDRVTRHETQYTSAAPAVLNSAQKWRNRLMNVLYTGHPEIIYETFMAINELRLRTAFKFFLEM